MMNVLVPCTQLDMQTERFQRPRPRQRAGLYGIVHTVGPLCDIPYRTVPTCVNNRTNSLWGTNTTTELTLTTTCMRLLSFYSLQCRNHLLAR